ncbi:MAG: trehalose-phosphatase, partial [Cytophagales bacterium]
RNLKDEIDGIVGRINGRFGTLSWTPIHYYYRSIPFETLIALYHLSPIALITPFRDGMNLVSKEYIATKPDGKGVLILSEMAGASKELVSALSVNPNNVESIVEALYKALNMKEEEMQKRMFEMQKVVKRSNVNKWGQKFIEALLDVSSITSTMYKAVIDGKTEEKLMSDYEKADMRLLFLDYDGTLVGFDNDPALAVPPEETLKKLDLLTKDPKNKIIIISGRKKDTLEEWLGHLKLDLVAEHGSWIKLHKQSWKSVNTQDLSWKQELTEILEQFSIKTAGSFIEEKSYSLVWHYRNVDPMLADIRKNELLETLNKFISDKQLNIQEGNKVIEVKPHNINKGAAAQKWIDTIAADFIMAIGDDITDEDTFKVMPENAYTIKVGLGETIAKYKIEGIRGVANLIDKMSKIPKS